MKKYFEKLMEKFQKDERGMTLVELLAVVVILAIVGAIAFVSIGNVMENSKKDAHVANAQQLISAAKLWEATNGDIPTNGIKAPSEQFNEIEELTNPWDASDDTYKGVVTKSNNEYKVKITADGETKCDIDHTESQINQGRKVVCDQD